MPRKVFAHRFKYSHEKRRKQLRKACKDGLVQMLAGIDKAQLLDMLGPEDFNRCVDILKEE